MFTNNLLLVYLGLLVVLFVIALVVILVSVSRSRKNGPGAIDGPTSTAPIPEADQRNTTTRQDAGGTYGQ